MKTIERLNVPGPKARTLMERDARVVAPAYGRVADLVMSHGHGSQVYDVDGNRYIDFVAGIAVNAAGHSHPKVVRAIQQATEQFLHISSDYYHERWVRLSERLSDIAPFEEDAQVFLANSGTESVEAAIKLARIHTGRHRFIGFLGGFHGRTLGSLAFTASKVTQREGFGTMPYVNHVPYPNPYRPQLLMDPEDEDYGDTVANYIERVLFTSLIPPDDVAAILVEPIQGEGGYVAPPPSFFPRLRQLCDEHGILLIVDEVQSGMGRTGKWWAIEHWKTEPDIICTAKGIASGVPLGAIIARKSVMTWKAGSHGNTYGGNPLACAAALATMEVLEESGIENAVDQGAYIMQQLREMAARHTCIGDVRGKGLMIGVEFVEDRMTRKPAIALRDRMVQLAFEHGLLIMGCGLNTMRVIPPLTVTRDEVDEGLAIFEHVLGLAEERI